MDKNLCFLHPVPWIVFTLCHTQHKGHAQVKSWFRSFINTTKTISRLSSWVLTPLDPCSPKSLYWTEIIVSIDALEIGILWYRLQETGETGVRAGLWTISQQSPGECRTCGESFLENPNTLQRNSWWYLFFKFQPPRKGRCCFRPLKCQWKSFLCVHVGFFAGTRIVKSY